MLTLQLRQVLAEQVRLLVGYLHLRVEEVFDLFFEQGSEFSVLLLPHGQGLEFAVKAIFALVIRFAQEENCL